MDTPFESTDQALLRNQRVGRRARHIIAEARWMFAGFPLDGSVEAI
jgi:hypothetical protein